MWAEMRTAIEDLQERVSSLEGWGEEDDLEQGAEEVQTLQHEPRSPLVRALNAPSPKFHVRRSDRNAKSSDEEKVETLEDLCLRWKDVMSMKLPPLPESEGALRAWKNSVWPMFMALDRSPENFLCAWLMKAFNSTSHQDIEALKSDSEGFDRLDRVLCSWLSKPDALKSHFRNRVQGYLEETLNLNSGKGLQGRVLLNLVVREFDLDSALGCVVSAVELFQLPNPDDSISSLETFRDRVNFILNQLPLGERPSTSILAKWLFEKLKKCSPLRLVIDRIRESPASAEERPFDYLWNRLQRIIVESQHDKNLQSIQDGLRKVPRKNVPGNPGTKGKGKGDKSAGKGGEGKSDGKKEAGKKVSKVTRKKVKARGKAKGKGKSRDGSTQGAQGSKDTVKDDSGSAQGASGTSTSQGAEQVGPCAFYAKGLCRRGSDCFWKA